jgi:broad specificity phosphatase PhoE
MMPYTLTLIRHGQSESNYAHLASQRGEKLPREKELMRLHTSDRRMTNKGVEQARRAGEWFREWYNEQASPRHERDLRCFVSPYMRARETAAHLGLRTRWRLDIRLCERNWGEIEQLTYEERQAKFSEVLERQHEFAYFWRPHDGETLQDVFLRTRDFVEALDRQREDMHVLCVTHGETMFVFRAIFEYLMPDQLRAAMASVDPRTDMRNCRAIQYRRLHPAQEGYFSHVRFVDTSAPDDPATNTEWVPVERKLLSEKELLASVEAYPRFFDGV